MAIDWDGKVLAPVVAVFGETVTYMPADGGSFSITGVFDEAYREIILLDGGTAITTEDPCLGVRLAAFPSGQIPRKGDQLAVLSVSNIYTVKDVRIDGHGGAKLMLNFTSAMP